MADELRQRLGRRGAAHRPQPGAGATRRNDRHKSRCHDRSHGSDANVPKLSGGALAVQSASRRSFGKPTAAIVQQHRRARLNRDSPFAGFGTATVRHSDAGGKIAGVVGSVVQHGLLFCLMLLPSISAAFGGVWSSMNAPACWDNIERCFGSHAGSGGGWA